jgi:hypothetical protein
MDIVRIRGLLLQLIRRLITKDGLSKDEEIQALFTFLNTVQEVGGGESVSGPE